MSKLKLNEIIWEITSKCNKGCKYCGSKAILNSKKEDYKNTIDIAYMIAKYPPKSVNLSGGEPGCMDSKILSECISVLHKADIEVKIITNGEILKKDYDFEAHIDYDKISLIGLSVNTLEDIEYAKKNFGVYLTPATLKNKIVIITNFGKHNIWDFDKIAEFAKDYSAGWQVQLTAGNDLNLPQDGIQQLWNKLENCSTTYVLADDLQKTHECQAGLQSCGITFDGYVMPCLSMRSWAKDSEIWDNKENYNLFNTKTVMTKNPLKNIWESHFKHRRFCDNCKCCRDDFEYPLNVSIIQDIFNNMGDKVPWQPPNPNNPITVTMYGVSVPYDPGTPLPYVYTDTTGDKPIINDVNISENASESNFKYGVSLPDKSISDTKMRYGVDLP